MDKKAYEDLLLEIAHCNIAENILANKISKAHEPCIKIVQSQEHTSKEDWQFSEPWVGDPSTAKIVFISSNPSYDKKEHFPDSTWSNDRVIDFFMNRFHGEKYVNIKRSNDRDRFYVLNKPLEVNQKSVRFWNAIGEYAKKILNKDNITHGVDYLITEVVHCKSRKEVGVSNDCIELCRNRYLKRIIDICSAAKYFVLVGTKSLNSASHAFLPDTNFVSVEELIGILHSNDKLNNSIVKLNSGKYLFWLPHPSSMIKNKNNIIIQQIKNAKHSSLKIIYDK